MLVSNKRCQVGFLSAIILTVSQATGCLAQALPAGTPAPGQGSGYFALGASSPIQQAFGNYVATPAGSERIGNSTVPIEYRFGLPVIFQHPYVPTDMAGPGGSLGHAQGILNEIWGNDFNSVPPSRGVVVARDPRYNFTGQWQPIIWGSARVAIAPSQLSSSGTIISNGTVMDLSGTRSLAAVIPGEPIAIPVVSETAATRLNNLFAYRDTDATKMAMDSQVMPTATAEYAIGAGNEIALRSGALLIKAGRRQPVYVNATVGGESLSVRLTKDCLAMVSVIDGRLTVANLSDGGRDSVFVFLSDHTRCDYGYNQVPVGAIAEIYPNAIGCAENELVAYAVHQKIALTDGLTYETMLLNYPRALKRFNITCVLNDCELRKVVKTAAAVSMMGFQQRWSNFL